MAKYKHKTLIRKDMIEFSKYCKLWIKRHSAEMAGLYAIYATRLAFKLIGR
jgi:hypothetical protein